MPNDGYFNINTRKCTKKPRHLRDKILFQSFFAIYSWGIVGSMLLLPFIRNALQRDFVHDHEKYRRSLIEKN